MEISKLLFIEDDSNKIERIMSFLKEHYSDTNIQVCRSYHSGVRAALSEDWDLLLLDISLPTFDVDNDHPTGYRTLHFGGRMILSELECEDHSIPTIIVTMFDQFEENGRIQSLPELNNELQKFPSYIGTVFYSASESDWEVALKKLFDKMETLKQW